MSSRADDGPTAISLEKFSTYTNWVQFIIVSLLGKKRVYVASAHVN